MKLALSNMFFFKDGSFLYNYFSFISKNFLLGISFLDGSVIFILKISNDTLTSLVITIYHFFFIITALVDILYSILTVLGLSSDHLTSFVVHYKNAECRLIPGWLLQFILFLTLYINPFYQFKNSETRNLHDLFLPFLFCN